MSETLVCQRCHKSFEVFALGHIQNQGTFDTLCRECQNEVVGKTDWEAIARGYEQRYKVIKILLVELSKRMLESSYLSHEQRYKVSCEIDELIRGIGL